MKLLYKLTDNQFEFKEINHSRKIVRAIVYDINSKKIVLTHLFCDDIFGHRDYYETPGGGVKANETLVEALKRELNEEIGIKEIINIEEIGRVIDYYNLINRENNNHYYLVYIDKNKLGVPHLEDKEKGLIDSLCWFSIDEAIGKYKSTIQTKIATLVIKRELPILHLAKKMLKNNNKD